MNENAKICEHCGERKGRHRSLERWDCPHPHNPKEFSWAGEYKWLGTRFKEKTPPEKSMPKKTYEPTDKKITLWAVLREAPECSENTVPNFIKHYHHWENNTIRYDGETNCLKEWLKVNPTALAWFVVKGFLREAVPAPEVTYKLTDWFMINNDKLFLCSPLAYEASLICLKDGHRWRDPVKIKDPQKITASEFSEIVGSNEFKKIPTPSTPLIKEPGRG